VNILPNIQTNTKPGKQGKIFTSYELENDMRKRILIVAIVLLFYSLLYMFIGSKIPRLHCCISAIITPTPDLSTPKGAMTQPALPEPLPISSPMVMLPTH
jgi:hypothetical protein